MDNHVVLRLAKRNGFMSSVDHLVNLYWGLRTTLEFGVSGEVVELGCNAGATSVFLRMIIDHYAPDRALHVFDSFRGLPAPTAIDTFLDEGDCRASRHSLERTFERESMALPVVHEGWFEDTIEELPRPICFAYIDADYYTSMMTALPAVWDRLSTRGLLFIDDYGDTARNPNAWEGLQGVKQACDDFFGPGFPALSVLAGAGSMSMACVRKT